MNERLIPVFVGMGLGVGWYEMDGWINTKQVPGLHNRMFSG